MRAAIRPPEEVSNLAPEAAWDRESHELLVVIRDDRAFGVRMRFEGDLRRIDSQLRKGHPQFELHSMNLHRFRIVEDLEAGRLDVGSGAPDEQLFVGDLIDTRFVSSGMDEVEIVVERK